MTELISNEKYIQQRGCFCPCCQAPDGDIVRAQPVHSEHGGSQYTRCKQCGTCWRETWALTGYTLISHGKETPCP